MSGSGRRLTHPGVPTKLAYLSVNGTGLAIAQLGSAHGVIAQESIDASLVGSGIGDAHTGIVVGVCLRWWHAQGGASAMAAAADAPIIALLIGSSFFLPPYWPRYCRHPNTVSLFVLKDHWRLAGRTLGERGGPINYSDAD